MKAGVVHAREDIRYEEIEKPVPKKGQVLIKVKSCGVCGSDIPRVMVKGTQIFHVSMGMHAISSLMYWDMSSQEQ